jgi:nucleotide-binding universal stress UspA family protein
MDEPARPQGPPRRLLLATDLSARSDRALDRAVQLAREWHADLVAMTVVETPERPDPLAVPTWPPIEDHEARRRLAQRQLERDATSLDHPASIHIAHGEAALAIAQTAADKDAGVIVTGMARNELFGRFLLGSTVERLVRNVPQPVLVVRNRVHGKYRRILVATDFSDASRHALHAAARFFAGRDLILYHAHQVPFAASADKAARKQIIRNIEAGECAAFLAGSDLPAEVRKRLRVVIEGDGLEIALGRYVREHQVDLAVLGTRGRTGLMNVLLASMAARLLAWLPCDTLIVRQPRN